MNKSRIALPRRFFFIARGWLIFCAVLRGYTKGQPINEARPRKVCC